MFAERQAINAPIQGTAADIMKLAMIKLYNHFKENNSDISMLLQVHDELVFEIQENLADKEIEIIKSIMEKANLPVKELSVSLKVEHGLAKTRGYMFDKVAYISDFKSIPNKSLN